MNNIILFNEIFEKAESGGFKYPIPVINGVPEIKPIFMRLEFWKALGIACQWAGLNDERDRKMTLGEYNEKHYMAYAMRFHKTNLDQDGGFDKALHNLHSAIFTVIPC